MKKLVEKTIEASRPAAMMAGAGLGGAKLIGAIGNLCKRDFRSLGKFGLLFAGITFIIVVAIKFVLKGKKQAESESKVKEQEAEASRYERERRADADLYTIQRMADENMIKTKARYGVYRQPKDNGGSTDNGDPDPGEDKEPEQKMTWLEWFNSNFPMPTLPPFLDKIMKGVPETHKGAMLLHLLSMLAAICFSKLRSKYSDGALHAPNLQVIIEGPWGAGKAVFERMYKTLFERVIDISKIKIEAMDNKTSDETNVIQTTGIGTSMSRFVDILASNGGCHLYLHNSEVKALHNNMHKLNQLDFVFLRKAFENDDICRNNRGSSQNGIFPIFLNYTITGTPNDIDSTFKKELEGGTLSRIAWCWIPEQGQNPSKLTLPEGDELEAIRDQIDEWTNIYCYRSSSAANDMPVEEVNINLDFVCEALEKWSAQQFKKSEEENNPARKDVRLRMAAIAFHCAMPLYILFGSPEAKDWQKRKQLTELVIYIANYCIERFLHKFGDEQNKQRKASQEAEFVNSYGDGQKQASNNVKSSNSNQEITDTVAAELYRLHNIKDKKGNNAFGYDTLAKKFGLNRNKVYRGIKKYEKEHPELQ